MIDLHCHLIPGLDDGPADLTAALALARACADDGVSHVVMTPHLYPGVFDNDLPGITQAAAAFCSALEATDVTLGLSFAAEIRVGIEVMELHQRNALPLLGADGSPRHVLLEMPDGQIPVGMHQLCAWLIERDVTPVIAHPERNKGVMAQPERLVALIDLGCNLQITAGSLLGDFGRQAHAMAEQLIDLGWVHAVASDAHGLRRRAPRLRAARDHLTRTRGHAMADWLTLGGPARLSGVPV